MIFFREIFFTKNVFTALTSKGIIFKIFDLV